MITDERQEEAPNAFGWSIQCRHGGTGVDKHPCCLHEPERRTRNAVAVCCWCGSCYKPKKLHHDRHGRYTAEGK